MKSWRGARWVARLWQPRQPQQAFLRLFELGLAFVALLGVQKMGTDIGQHESVLLTTGLVLLLVVHVLVIIECLRPSGLPWAITVVAGVGIVLVVLAQVQATHTGPLLWRIDAWLGVPLAFLAIIHPKGPKLPLLACVTVGCLITFIGTGQGQWGQPLLSTFFTAVQLVLLMLARWVVIALLDEHLESLAARQLDEERDETTRARTEALAAVRRSMHDSLLHCLQRISALWHSSTPEQIRAMCAATREQLATVPMTALGTRPGSSIVADLRLAVTDEPCAITWEGDGSGVPPLVAEALEGAVVEAVHNVIKHCDRAEALIRVSGTGEGVQVEVSDGGPGFTVGSPTAGRSGVADSVIGRMADVGGRATLVSGPAGTTVTLVWPAPLPPAEPGLGRVPRNRLSLTPVPLVLGSIANVVAFPTPDPVTAWTLWAILVAILAAAAVTLRRRGLTDVEAWALCAVALVALIANIMWVDPAVDTAWALWVPSLAGCFMFLALPGRETSTALAMAGTMLGTTVAASLFVLGPAVTFITHFGAMMAVLTHVLFTLVLAFGTSGISRHVHGTRQLEAAVRHRARDAVEREGVWRAWLQQARLLTDGFLADIAEGRRAPTADGTRQEAAWHEARIRDELRLWPVSLGIAARLDTLRRAGWQVRMDLDAPCADVLVGLEALLDRLPPPLPSQRMTVAQRAGGAVLTLSDPALTDEHLAALAPWVVVTDPDFTQLAVRTASRSTLIGQEA